MNKYLVELAKSTFDRQMEVGGLRCVARPPSVLFAVQLMALAGNFEDWDETDAAAWDDVLLAWMGNTALYHQIVKLSPKEQVGTVMALIAQGAPGGETDKPRRAEEGDLPVVRWDMLVVDYCLVFGGEPFSMMRDTPWPFFLLMCSRLDAAKARVSEWELQAEIIPHTGKDSRHLIKQLSQRAGKNFEPTGKQKAARYKSSLDALKARMRGRP